MSRTDDKNVYLTYYANQIEQQERAAWISRRKIIPLV